MVKPSVTGQPGIGWRLPSKGSLSLVKPSNFVPMIQAFWTNSNCRPMLALMP